MAKKYKKRGKKVNNEEICKETAEKERYEKSCENAIEAGKTFYDIAIKPQEFPLPNTIMKYLWKTPSNSEGYQKLIQTCKIFFAKNPILIFPACFYYEGYSEDKYWRYCPKMNCKYFEGFTCHFQRKINLEKIGCKIWPIYDLDIRYTHFPKTLLPKIYRSNAKEVALLSDKNYLKDIIFLASSAINLGLSSGVFGDDGQQIFVEDYINHFPLLQEFGVMWDEKNPPCKNFEKLFTSLRKRTNFFRISFRPLPDEFDIEAVLECAKQLKIQFETIFDFSDTSSPKTVKRLLKIVDKIIKTKDFDYFPPHIWFYYLKKEKYETYEKLISKIEEYRSKKCNKTYEKV